MIDIRLPNITATDTEGKMSQMQSYMHQLVERPYSVFDQKNLLHGSNRHLPKP